MQSSERSSWQWVVLALVGVSAVIVCVCLAVVAAVGAVPGGQQAAARSPTPSATRPIIHTRTPTPTFTPTRTPGPSPTPTATATPTPTPTPTPIVTLVDVQALGKLETAQYVMQTIVDLQKEPSGLWQQIFGTDKLLLVAAGEVVAGFDLTQIGADDVIVQGKSITLWLPPPEIFYVRVDNQKTYVYLRETGFLVSPDPHLETQARRMAEQALEQWALDHQVLSKAEEFGVLYLKSFLRSLGFTDVTIRVRRTWSAHG